MNKFVIVGGCLLAGAAGWARLARENGARAEPERDTTIDHDEAPSDPSLLVADPPDSPDPDHIAGLQFLVDHDQLTGLRASARR